MDPTGTSVMEVSSTNSISEVIFGLSEGGIRFFIFLAARKKLGIRGMMREGDAVERGLRAIKDNAKLAFGIGIDGALIIGEGLRNSSSNGSSSFGGDKE